ncbi:hypothetical protein NLA06_12655 [Desulfomicrobium sp. ZS1]|uniref:hypothetical protein n=1 Tax=Desulfomicrobium sp. ZS1 TaxID=2952228 RepID=UPI0020B39B19|nr:hypothetical protein [Desulfomicrobium sp. ZS1]UTF49407.1 hypothetical protein NLA06_12655 [Desulfomicrobium sp. ZS1]
MGTAANQFTDKNNNQDLLGKIVVGMATLAPVIDGMEQEQRLKMMEFFGAMVDAAISERARA